jgi:indolepyruvate ferredoxin oxidoreductase alpha subunit
MSGMTYVEKKYAHKTFPKYSSPEVAEDSPGKAVLFSGNEAQARGCVEAGVYVATSYPGSPSTYTLESLAIAAKIYNFHAEWSTNEKCAFETALGAASCGKRAAFITKNVGLSWAMDPLMNCIHLGLPAGLVLLIGDDPDANTTSVEQDSRLLAIFAEIPVLQPVNQQELKDLVIEAFELSEYTGIPVQIVATRSLLYGRGKVILGPIRHDIRERKPYFDHDPIHWTCNVAPSFTRETLASIRHHRFHDEVIPRLEKTIDDFRFNKLKLEGHEKVGVIASGVPYLVALEAARKLGIEEDIAFLKLVTTHPLPKTLVKKLLESVETVLVVEEIEPMVEHEVRSISAEMEKHANIRGKLTGDLPRIGEIGRDDVGLALSRIIGCEYSPSISPDRKRLFETLILEEIVRRPQGYFCPGCPEMAGVYAVKMVTRKLYKDKYICHGDIGCYEHSHSPPWDLIHSVLCMGAGPGMGHGQYHTRIGEKIICTFGDGTLIHAAIPELINAVYNKSNVTFIIYDNRVIASTGHQPHPAAFGLTAMDEPTKMLDIPEIARACGADFVEVVNPYDVKKTMEVVEKAFKTEGVSVVVMRQVCAVVAERQMGGRALMEINLYQIDQEKCLYINKGVCGICFNQLGCPSFEVDHKTQQLFIDSLTCFGCGVCAQICPVHAIKMMEKKEG